MSVFYSYFWSQILGRHIAVENKVMEQSQAEDVLALCRAFSLDVL